MWEFSDIFSTCVKQDEKMKLCLSSAVLVACGFILNIFQRMHYDWPLVLDAWRT
ncbi:hypothetical protein I79_007527 [Cricetulus griseus]|uniref:Uncharacterized protein n=1 Tax=Cricetulus griseus TaxID=10029 RepID=G3HAR9_CRIGR|nr:hypothetical protein I79_007527 [Cricetulus griseus]